jgi:outer membrane protein W
MRPTVRRGACLLLVCLMPSAVAFGHSSTTRLAKVERGMPAEPEDPTAEVDVSPAAVPPPAAGVAVPTEAVPFAKGDSWYGFYFRLGGLFIAPTGRSKEVELVNVSPMAHLSGVTDGPIAGSWSSLGSNLMAAATIGWAPPILNRQLSIETILALPFAQKMYLGGTVANTSLAPMALGVLPTGVPPLGSELGEVTVLPPVVTLVYRFFPAWRVRPYVGLGASLLIVMGAKITNPVISEVSQPKVEIPPKLGWVVQGGVEVRLFGSFFLTGDFKYIGGLDLTAKVSNIWVRLPKLPLYGATRVGDNIVRVSVNPIVVQLGIGMNL